MDINRLPNWLRWILFLPAAIASYFIGFMLAVLIDEQWPIPSFLLQFYYSALCPLIFVFTGMFVAPSRRFAIALTLTIINAIFCAVIVTLALQAPATRVPVWWLAVCSLAG